MEMDLEELARSLPTVNDEIVDTVIVSNLNASIPTSTIGYVVAYLAAATSLTSSIALTRAAVDVQRTAFLHRPHRHPRDLFRRLRIEKFNNHRSARL